MKNAVCADGRVRGMFAFYGAVRTGRWAGRLVQLQNLYRNSLPDLEAARKYERLKLSAIAPVHVLIVPTSSGGM